MHKHAIHFILFNAQGFRYRVSLSRAQSTVDLFLVDNTLYDFDHT